MRWARIAIASAAAAGVSAAGDARAADVEQQHGAKWAVEAEGVGCDRYRPAFERELVLACTAMATCRVVPAAEAELVATLRCEAGSRSWWLSMRTVEGTPLSSVELTGTSDDALREGAIEVAHDAAPERTLAAETLRNTLGDHDVPRHVVPPPKLALTISGVTTGRSGEGMNGGVRLGAGYKVGPLAHLLGSVMGGAGGSGGDAFRRFRSGFGIALGAPFTTHVVGIAFDAGLDVTNGYDGQFMVDRTVLRARTRLDAYAQQTFFVQAPLGRVRPYLALGIGVVSADPIVMGSADIGVQVPVF
jgi:hypothetical protein